MANSTDYRRQFCTLQEEVKNAIRDLMVKNHLTEIELDNETSFNHLIGYYSDLNGWMEQEIRKIKLVCDNDQLVLTTIYEDELFNDSIPADEWVNILGAVEEQVEKKQKYYIVIDYYYAEKRCCLGYGDLTYLDECEHYATLMDAKKKVLRTAKADIDILIELPIYTIYETKGDQTTPVSHMFSSQHCYLLGIEPPVVTDDLINQGLNNAYIHII